MLKIWAKTVKEDKITRDFMFKKFEKFNGDKLMDYLVEICYQFDIPTPMLLTSHLNNFEFFNIVKFKETDFVEPIDFEFLVLENASE